MNRNSRARETQCVSLAITIIPELQNTKIYGLVEQKHLRRQIAFATRGPKFLYFVILGIMKFSSTIIPYCDLQESLLSDQDLRQIFFQYCATTP